MKMKQYIQPETSVMKLALQEGIMELSNISVKGAESDARVGVDEAWSRDEREGFSWE